MKFYSSNLNMWRLAAGLLLFIASCANKYGSRAVTYTIQDSAPRPDYSKLSYWAAHPWKNDPSDSIPADLRNEPRDSTADVFFIYPTTYTAERKEWNADINDAYLNAKTDFSSILYQASVFNQHCRIFSPRYRQAHLSAFFIQDETTKAAFDTAYDDVKQAFLFYLARYNNNRPIVIAGHSQGALMAERLLQEFFDGRPLQQRLIAAYIIGWPVAPGLFTKIPVCTDSLQTGCFCSWRTLRKGYMTDYMKAEPWTAIVTNPLSWRTDTIYVAANKNQGSILKNFNKLIPHTTDAQIHKGVLWVNKPRFPGSAFFRSRNYHIADINLFYMNLRRNVAQRIAAWK